MTGEDRLSQVTMLDEELGSAEKVVDEDSRGGRLPWEHQVCWEESCELVGTEAGFWGKWDSMDRCSLEGRVSIKSHVVGALTIQQQRPVATAL